ncbi:Hypothetical protein A7982_00092 [Minicystis rosea]|nr:Hypothetical protein A7982_00092 [Minicystis rosea]
MVLQRFCGIEVPLEGALLAGWPLGRFDAGSRTFTTRSSPRPCSIAPSTKMPVPTGSRTMDLRTCSMSSHAGGRIPSGPGTVPTRTDVSHP